MNYYIVEDSELAKRNRSLLVGCGDGPSYNAVLSVVFSDESLGEHVTLAEAKDWIRVDIDDDDTLITALITGARIVCENYANLSFIQRTVTARIVNGLGGINLPYGPAGAITAATDYYDEDITTDFSLNTTYSKYITVVYTAGYSTLPENLRTALLNQIAWMYENRGDAKLASGVSELTKLILNQVRNV